MRIMIGDRSVGHRLGQPQLLAMAEVADDDPLEAGENGA
jgi:hypothetical protein